MLPAALAAVELAVLVEEVVVELLDFPRSLENRPLVAFFAAFVATVVAADVASEERSVLERLVRALRTLVELLLFTRFFEPEMSPERKLDVLEVFPMFLMLLARVMTFAMLFAFVMSSLPSALYCVYSARRAVPALVPLLVVSVWACAVKEDTASRIAAEAAARILNVFMIWYLINRRLDNKYYT